MSKFMHPTLKAQLLDALQVAVSAANADRGDYVGAVSKAAQEYKLNPNQTIRLCEMFNRVRALNQYQGAEKAADYQVVDPKDVLGRMTDVVPRGEKAACDGLGHRAYAVPETLFAGGLPVEPRTAEKVSSASAPSVTWGATVENRSRAALNMLRERRATVEKAAGASRMLQTRCGLMLDGVAREIEGQGEKAAVESLARLGRLHQADRNDFGLARALADRMPRIAGQVTREKLASVRVPVVLDRDQARWNATLDAVAHDREQATVLGVWADNEKRAADEDAAHLMGLFQAPEAPRSEYADFLADKQAAVPHPPAKPSAPPPSLAHFLLGNGAVANTVLGDGKKDDAPKDHLLTHAARAMPNTADLYKQLMREVPLERAEKERQAQIAGYADVDREVVLSELMMTDPILRDADEDKILRAYRGLITMSPDLTRNKELMRSILRQAVKAEGIGPYEAQAFTTLEKSMRGLELPATTQPSKPAPRDPAERDGKDRK